MANYTTPLNLRKPTRTAGDNNVVDVELDVNGNMSLLDDNMVLYLATSGSRPSSPFQGMMIYETDTTNIMLWDGTEWESLGNNNSGKGRVAYVSSTTSGTTLTSASAETLYISVSFSRDTDRKYLVETGFYTECTATTAPPGGAQARVRYAAGASVTTAGTLLGSFTVFNPLGTGTANAEHFYSAFEIPGGGSGTHTVGLFMGGVGVNDSMRFSGAASARTNWLSIRDSGAA